MQRAVSRRALLRAGAALSLGVLGSHALGTTAEAQQKVAKAVVTYENAPSAGRQCSTCSNFFAPDECTVVLGKISPHGWCAIWTPK
jgi:hypothetical protein